MKIKLTNILLIIKIDTVRIDVEYLDAPVISIIFKDEAQRDEYYASLKRSVTHGVTKSKTKQEVKKLWK